MTDEQLINDDDGKEKARRQQSNPCKTWKQNTSNDRERTETADGRELRKVRGLRWEDHDAKINQMKNHTIVRVVDRMMGGGKKKGQKKQDKKETTSSSESDALQDMFMDLMKEDDDKGNSVFRTMMQLDDEMAQEALSKMKQAFAENGKKFGMQKLSFEAVDQWIYENRSTTQQAVRAEHEKAIQEAEQREQEVRRFKEEQKQIMIEKERQARENEREKREQETMMNNDRVRSAAQALDEREAEKQREMKMKEMKIRFGRYHGRDCETIYQEDRNYYCQWVLDVETGNRAVIEFKNFIKARNEQ